jgi:hypothetical protein
MSPVHLNRTLQRLRARNIVTWETPHVEVLNREALAYLAEFSEDLDKVAKDFSERAKVLDAETQPAMIDAR